MSSATHFEKGTQTAAAFLKEKKNKNRILGIVLGILVLCVMSTALLMKG